MSEKKPEKYDVVLGGQSDRSQPPVDGVVLGNLNRFTVDLQSLLQQQKWQAADLETQRIMLDICQRQTAGFLQVEDLAKISCLHWQTLDNLWRIYSNDRFGISIQAEIWRSVGGASEPDWNAWCRFGRATGWCIDNEMIGCIGTICNLISMHRGDIYLEMVPGSVGVWVIFG